MASTNNSFTSLTDYKAYHILTYGTFLGATFFQTFMAGPLAYKALPRPMFSRLQQVTFPPFFALQTVLPLVLAVTYPGEAKLAALGKAARINEGFSGVMAEGNLVGVLVPIAAMLVSSALNLGLFGPLTTKAMKQRHHQETRDGKKSYDAGPQSDEMAKLNKQFAILHGVSSLANLIGFIAAIAYAFNIASKI